MPRSTILSSILCCPRCRGQIGEGIPCCLQCGTRYAQRGSVVDFLDAATADSSEGIPIEEFVRGIVEAPTSFIGSLASQGAEGDSLRAVAQRIDLGQVLSDVKRILIEEDCASPSEFLDFLLAYAGVGRESSILDVGASCGRYLWELKPLSPCVMVALDINLIVLKIGSLAWEKAHSPVHPTWTRADALRLPLRNAALTHVMSNVTLILLPFQAALNEFFRVLQPGGCAIFTVEGPGAWRSYWDNARPWSRRRVNLLRSRLGNALLKAGAGWQDRPVLRRLSIHSQFDLPTVKRFVARAGFTVETCDVLKAYKNRPSVIGVVARKP